MAALSQSVLFCSLAAVCMFWVWSEIDAAPVAEPKPFVANLDDVFASAPEAHDFLGRDQRRPKFGKFGKLGKILMGGRRHHGYRGRGHHDMEEEEGYGRYGGDRYGSRYGGDRYGDRHGSDLYGPRFGEDPYRSRGGHRYNNERYEEYEED